LVYGSEFTTAHLSDSLFVVGMVTFFPALVMQTRSYQVFYGMRYGFKAMFNKDFYQQYPNFRDYRETKDVQWESTVFVELMVVSAVIILAGIILGAQA
jgi:hypothetical protein